MVLICDCGSHEIRITNASESVDENGFVESFWEKYRCKICDRTGKYYVYEDNSDRLTGCLTRTRGVW